MVRSTTKPCIFILVPGSFSLLTFFEKVDKLLKDAGYLTELVYLPTVGKQFKEAHGHAAGIYDDAEHINATATKHCNASHDVVLVGNSYGGFVITEAAKGLTLTDREATGQSGGSLIAMVLLSNLLAEVGQTVLELVGDGKNAMPIEEQKEEEAVEFVYPLPAEMNAKVLLNELPDEEEEERLRFGQMMDVHSAASFVDPLTYAGWKYVPVTFVVADRDENLPPKAQHDSVDRATEQGFTNVKKLVLEADHSMMVSQPERVAELLSC